MKKTLLTLLTLILTVVLGAQVANAIGSLTASGTAGDATQYTLNDIYAKLTTNSSTSTKSGLFGTPGSVAASFRTLAEIYGAIPTIDATKVATGTTYLGVAGTLQGAPAPLTWQTDPNLQLCWDANQGCSAGSGVLDPVGDQSILLGAVEYCQYLDADGTTVQTTPQNVWHLPTPQEFISITDFSTYNNATQVPGFAQYSYYWSSTEYANNPSYAWIWYTNDGYINNDYGTKFNQYHVRCVR